MLPMAFQRLVSFEEGSMEPHLWAFYPTPCTAHRVASGRFCHYLDHVDQEEALAAAMALSVATEATHSCCLAPQSLRASSRLPCAGATLLPHLGGRGNVAYVHLQIVQPLFPVL